MKLLRYLVIFILVVVALLAGGAYLLPRNVVIQREIVLNAPPDAVFEHMNSLKAAAEWSPWMRRDPDLEVTYGGPDAGVGATMEWTSDDPAVGNGRQEILASVPNERVESALDFGDMGTAQAWFDLAPEGDGTRVVWGLDADMGNNPVGRWMGLMMDRWVGADYETGLSNLRALVEG